MTLPERPDSSLRAAADRQLSNAHLAAVLRQHCPYLAPHTGSGELSTEIPPGCQMLEFSLRHHRDAALSVSQYFAVALQQYQTLRQIIDRVFDDSQSLRVLDFACGYGRLLRFLVHSLKPDQIWAAEIQSEALDYVTNRFDVHGLQSTPSPEAFRPEQKFDVIWVASLFSHLPNGLFQRWLNQLAGLLQPGGILCFSVHDQALLPDSSVMPDEGLLYTAHSENEDLDGEIYGTTFVSEAFVQSAIRSALGHGLDYRRFNKLLAHEQDVYICVGPEGPDLSSLEDFRRGPRGWVDEHYRDGDDLVLKGWAASVDDGDLDVLEINFAGQLVCLKPDQPSADVARVLDDPRLSNCGFTVRIPWTDDEASPYLVISAISRRNERALVFAGQLYR